MPPDITQLVARIQALEDSAQSHKHLGYDFSSRLINIQVDKAQIINGATLGDGNEHSGTLTMKIADGKGDCYILGGTIAAGDFANTGAGSGFILGLDDSDSNKGKFYFGNATGNVVFNGTSLTSNGFAITANVAQFSGDGSDGVVTISAGTTTLTRDMYYQTLTIASGARLATAGYKVYVKGTLTMTDATSFISNNSGNGGNGGNGSGSTGGTAGTAGAAAAGGSTATTIAGKAGQAGAAGKTGNGDTGTAGTAGTATTGSLLSSSSVLSGAGGNGGNTDSFNGGSGQASGAVATTTVATRLLHTISEAILFINFSTVGTPALYTASASAPSGGSAGGGAANGADVGGGGGGSAGSAAPAGVCFVFATTISGTGYIEANGGNGGDGGTGGDGTNGGSRSGGGGGGAGAAGGNGGLTFCAYASKSVNVTLRANGGSAGAIGVGGAGKNLGTNGVSSTAATAGATGTTIEFNLSS